MNVSYLHLVLFGTIVISGLVGIVIGIGIAYALFTLKENEELKEEIKKDENEHQTNV